MPVLRMEPDNTLAETLGSLGNSLSSAFNPLNMVRSQNLQSEIQQRQWEIQHAQTLDAANRNAADVYVRSNPFNQDPASLAVSAAKIRNGQGDLEGAVNAAKALGTWQGNQAASALVDADPELNGLGWSDADRASVKARVLNGEPLAVAKQQHANSVLDTTKLTATQGGVASAQTPAAKEAAALGQPETSVQLDTANKLLTAPPITGALSDPGTQAAIDQRVIERGQAKIPVTADMPVSSGETQNIISRDVAKDAAQKMFGWHDPNQVFSGGVYNPSDLTVTPAPPAPPPTLGAPPVAPVAPAAPPGAVSVAPAPADIPTVAQTESGKTTAHEIATGDVKVLDNAMSESEGAQAMKSKLSQLRDLAEALDTSGAGLTARVLRTLSEYNVHPGDIGATYAAIQQIINAEIPDVRQKAGIQRLAGPAIKEEQLILGTANMPKKTLMNIIANEEASADLQIQRANLAYKARSGQMPMDDYYKQSLALDATIKQHTDELRNQYRAIGTEKTQPAPEIAAPPAPLSGNSVMDAVHKFVNWWSGGGNQPQTQTQTPAPVPQQQPTEQYDIDANGHPVRVR